MGGGGWGLWGGGGVGGGVSSFVVIVISLFLSSAPSDPLLHGQMILRTVIKSSELPSNCLNPASLIPLMGTYTTSFSSYRSRFHERTISLRFLGIILRVRVLAVYA